MQFKKIVALLTLIMMVFSLLSCNRYNENKENENQQGQQNNGETNQTPDENSPSDKTPSENTPSDDSETELIFVYSVVRKVIHREDCASVALINKEYREEVKGDITGLLLDGFRLCSTCFPVENEKEEPEDDENKITAEEATFVLNTSNMKIHDLECRHIKTMNEKNIEYTNLTIEELLALKYIPCGTCLTDEYEDYMGR